MNKIALFVMTEKGYEVSKGIISLYPEMVDRVVIGTDANVEDDFSDEIRSLCEDHAIDWAYRREAPNIDPESYVFAVSWRWIINHPQHRLVVFHDSLLPKYRGFAPLVNMLINGERHIGVTAIFGAPEYDTGDIIGQRQTSITYPIKIREAIKINNQNFVELAEDIAKRISESAELTATPQSEDEATYSIWRDANDYVVDWTQSAERIARFIDAVGAPYGGARTRTSDGRIVAIDDAEVVDDVSCELRHCGKVIFVEDSQPVVICGKGLLKIKGARLLSDEGESPFIPVRDFRHRFC